LGHTARSLTRNETTNAATTPLPEHSSQAKAQQLRRPATHHSGEGAATSPSGNTSLRRRRSNFAVRQHITQAKAQQLRRPATHHSGEGAATSPSGSTHSPLGKQRSAFAAPLTPRQCISPR